MDLAPGSVFANDYRIVAPLSAGGMGAVFVVEQLSTGKRRALKLMHRELAADPMSRQRFEQEARVGSRIASEHVVEVQAAGVDAQTRLPYLVMELLEGEDMATRLRRGPFAPAEAQAVLAQLAHAMGAAHDAGVVHRDLKPENIFLGVQRRLGGALVVKVLDFGIAKVMEGHNRTTGAYGTPMWLAPEQTQRGEITPAADVWAFGLIAFIMLTGRPFWHSGDGPNPSITSLIQEIIRDPIPAASSRAAEFAIRLPEGFDAWFARAVTRDPRARFPNARIAQAALAPVLSGIAFAQTAMPVTAPLVHAPEAKKAEAGKTIAIVVALLVLVGGVALALTAFIGARTTHDDRVVSSPSPSALVPSIMSTAKAPLVESTMADPAPTVSAPPRPAQVGGMVFASDATLQTDAQAQFNGAIAESMNTCLATHPRAPHDASLTIQVKVKPDGSVVTAQTLGGVAGRNAQCMADAIKSTKFVKTPRGGDLTFMVVWNDH